MSVEPVTRIWLSDPAEPHVLLAGSTEGDGNSYDFGVDELFARLPAIEAYRRACRRVSGERAVMAGKCAVLRHRRTLGETPAD